jgi:tetratricopeptide (TPR) repeat protein
MQVLVVLADAADQVVTRETLFNRCWGGVYVSDDSLNRAVAAVRRAAANVGGNFQIETIPRTGYRLKVPHQDQDSAGSTNDVAFPLSRRRLAGSAVALATLAGIGGWSALRYRTDRHFDALIQNGEAAVRRWEFDEKALRTFEEAVSLEPDNAKALGLLALVKSITSLSADANDMPRVVAQAESIARKALMIDPREPNALLAMVELQGSALDWATRDTRLRHIIAIDPKNLTAIDELVLMLQAAGLNRESWDWNERALAMEPLSPGRLGRRALKLWIAGRLPDADKVIDQARSLWPSDPFLWRVRFMIFALTGRPRAADAMRTTDPATIGPPQAVELWKDSLPALDHPSPKTITAARAACFKGAMIGAHLAGDAVMILSALGDVDAAFEVATGFLIWRGSVVQRGKTPFKPELPDAAWRINTQWLFVPPAASMRADPRFLALCEGVGLTTYWRSRKVRPDYQLT